MIPIWEGGAPKPASVRLIRGTTELLLWMGIVKKLDAVVNCGADQFGAGRSEWGMMTFNGKHRWVFPLVPTDCACAELNDYFGKFRGAEIEVLKSTGVPAEI